MIGLWQRAGVFVNLAYQLDPARLAATLREERFGWVAVLVHDGTTALDGGLRGKLPAWLETLRDAGIRVGGWGVLRENPATEARVASARLRELGLSHYVADAELEYKYTTADGSFCGRCFLRSRDFVAEFRSLEPTMPAAVSSYPRFDLADLHWATWYAAGFRALPQAYYNEFGDFASPAACVRGAVDVRQPGNVMRDARGRVIQGWPRSWVHPTVGVYDVTGRPHVSMAEWVDLLDDPIVPPGFSVYLGEFLAQRWEEWGTLGVGIRDRGLARYD